MRISITAVLMLGWIGTGPRPAIAAELPPPAVATMVSRMNAALDPDRPSIRTLTFRISGLDGDAEIKVGKARRKVGDVVRELVVVLAPESLRGTAYLVEDSEASDDVQWMYVPAVGRVRKLISPEAYAAFLNSDFTYADLGFARLQTRYRFDGEEARGDTRAYRIEGVPEDSSYYTRTVTWVAAESEVPLERHMYDAAHRLWKIERFQDPTVIDGVPTLRRISMEDLQAKTRTDIEVTAVRYDVDVPAALFDPMQLPNALRSPVWQELGGI